MTYSHTMSCLDDSGLSDHDLSVDTYRCEGCHQRAHKQLEEDILTVVTPDDGSERPVLDIADPYNGVCVHLAVTHMAMGHCSLPGPLSDAPPPFVPHPVETVAETQERLAAERAARLADASQ